MPTLLRSKQLPIMVVDDDVNGCDALCEHLRFRGYRATSIHSGADALDYLLKLCPDERPCVILLDVLMPGLSGCEVLKEIRSHSETQEIPVIMLSVLSKEDIQDQFAGACGGANAYVCKPFDMEKLIGQLENLLYG